MVSLLLYFLFFFISQTCLLVCLLVTLLLTALMLLTLLYCFVHLLSPFCAPAAFTVLSISIIIHIYILADLTFFYSFSSLLIYFSDFVYASAGSDSIYYQCCINMNTQCKLVPPSLCEQLNHILAVLNAVACGIGNLTIFAGLECLFVGTVCCHYHHLHCFIASASAAIVTNPFSSLTKFSHLILAFKGIFDILCYQVCWSFLIKARQN